MASVTITNFQVVKNVANADITLDYTINWSAFDMNTNLQYSEAWKLIGDDTGQDGDDVPVGDDPINLGLMFLGVVSSNGQASTPRSKSKTIAFSNLDEDVGAAAFEDDELRAVVTLTPLLPAVISRESDVVVVNA